MKKTYLLIFGFAISSTISSCFGQTEQKTKQLIDSQATVETIALYQKLDEWAENHIVFGHQSATEYGHGWTGDKDRSDVKSVTGSHPGIVGLDFSGISGRSKKDVRAAKAELEETIIRTHAGGSLITMVWHFRNPVTPETGFYWKEDTSAAAVQQLVPGGSHHSQYQKILKEIAEVAKESKDQNDHPIPMIFRPFHEFDGDWFWWGKGHTTRADFQELWKFTVSYLRDSLDVHNFIYAFSPDCLFQTEAEYLERYPGDDWVDLVGMDNYADFGRDGKYNLDAGVRKLKIISDYAKKHHKLAAFTETGLESVPKTDWWTTVLLKTLKSNDLRLAYVLVWRNDSKSPTHFYAPYPGQISEADFRKFYNDPYTYFAKDLK